MNLACGCLVLVFLFNPPFESQESNAWLVAGLMGLALAADFADGFVARLLGVSSELGKQLDSLADMVTFGLVPGMMVFVILQHQIIPEFVLRDYMPSSWTPELNQPAFYRFFPYLGLLIPLFSAWRLAKFNVDTRQTDHFRGLATPPNAFFFTSIFMIHSANLDAPAWKFTSQFVFGEQSSEPFPGFLSFLADPIVLSIVTIVFSVLLVTDLPLLAFKVKDYSFRKNISRYLLLGISLILLIILWYKAVPFIIVLYFLFSFIERVLKKS